MIARSRASTRMSPSNAAMRPGPCALARYIAASASRSSEMAVSAGDELTAWPMPPLV